MNYDNTIRPKQRKSEEFQSTSFLKPPLEFETETPDSTLTPWRKSSGFADSPKNSTKKPYLKTVLSKTYKHLGLNLQQCICVRLSELGFSYNGIMEVFSEHTAVGSLEETIYYLCESNGDCVKEEERKKIDSRCPLCIEADTSNKFIKEEKVVPKTAYTVINGIVLINQRCAEKFKENTKNQERLEETHVGEHIAELRRIHVVGGSSGYRKVNEPMNKNGRLALDLTRATAVSTSGASLLTDNYANTKRCCPICCEAFCDTIPLLCGHILCKSCFSSYLFHAIDTQQNIGIPCPFPNCTYTLPSHYIKQYVDPDKYHKYKIRRHELTLIRDKKITYCTYCGYPIVIEQNKILPTDCLEGTDRNLNSGTAVKIGCPNCNNEICGKCKRPCHEPLSCIENMKAEYDTLASGHEVQFCPTCGNVVSRIKRCGHMYCKVCEKAFCIYCRQDMKKGHYTSGNEKMCKAKAAQAAKLKNETTGKLRVLIITILAIILAPFTALIVMPYAGAVSMFHAFRRRNNRSTILPEATLNSHDPKTTTTIAMNLEIKPPENGRHRNFCAGIVSALIFVLLIALSPLIAAYLILLILVKLIFLQQRLIKSNAHKFKCLCYKAANSNLISKMMDKKDSNAPTTVTGRLKHAIFRTLALSLDHNIINTPLYLLMLLLELYQILPYIYIVVLRVSDKVPKALELYEGIINTLFSITLNTSILNASFTSVTGGSFAILVIFTGLLVFLIYLGSVPARYKQLIKLSQKYACLFKLISFTLKFVCTVGTLPAFALFLLSFNCTTLNGTSVFATDKTVKCWSGLHIAVAITSSIDLIFIFILLLLVETMLYESSPKSTLPWASCGTNKGLAVKHLAKVSLVCFYLFDPTAELHHYFFIIQIVLHGFIVYWIFLSPPYVSRWIGYFTIFEHTSLFCIALWGYIIRLNGDVILYPGIIMITAIFVTKGILVLFAKDAYDRHIISMQSFDTKEISQKEYYFYELFYYLDQYSAGDSQAIIVLNGLYMNHQRLCNNSSCQCMANTINAYLEEINKKGKNDYDGKDVARLQGSEEVERQKVRRWEGMSGLFQVVGSRVGVYDGLDENNKSGPGSPRDKLNGEEELLAPTNYQLLLNMISSIIEHEVQSNIGCVALRMISSYYAKEYIGNVFKAVYDIFYIEEKLKPSFQEAFLAYKAKKDIDEEIAIFSQKKAGDNVVDVESLILFEEHYKKFRNYAEMGSNYANRFWELLKNKDLDVNGLYDIGSKVGEIYTEMHKSYSVAIEIFPQNHKLVKEFGYYEKHVMNNELLANEYEAEAKRITQEQAEHTNEIEDNEIQIIKSTSLHHTCICVASGNPGSMGDILTVNDEIQYNLGLKAKEIIGQNCSSLTPPYIAVKHNAMLESFIKSGVTNFLGALRVVAACNSKGFLVMMDLVIKILPSIDRGLCFVAIFKKFDNFSLYFPNVHIPCYPSDFAMIVANLEGQLLGINENCMTRLGIPVSIFKGNSSADESVTIQTLIKELNQPEIVDELKTDGRKIEIDTKPFLYSINRENLPPSEAKYLEGNAGKFTVFARLNFESYAQNVKVQIVRMIILSDAQSPAGGLDTVKFTPEKEDDKNVEGTLKREKETPATNLGKDSKLETGRKQTEDLEIDTKRDLLQERGFSEIKQNINTKSSGLHVTTMNKWVHILILVILALASTEFGLLLNEKSQYDFYTDIVHVANKRILHAGLIHSQVLANVNMTNTGSSPITELGLNLYEYLREYGFRSIGILNAAGSWINTAGFDYNDKLYSLEKRATINMITLGRNSQITEILHTLNTAITQYTAKAADFMSYSFHELREAILTATPTSPISTDYFFIVKNGLGSLAEATQATVTEYTSIMKDNIGKYIKYYIGVSIVIGLAVIICFGIIVPKLVGVQSEKIHILLLYTQMNRNEINSQIERCVEYQRISGYLEVNEDAGKEEWISQEASELERVENKSTPGEKERKEEVIDLDKSGEEEKDKGYKERSDSNEDEDSSDEDESEEKYVDENEKTIYETMDTTKLNAKLTTNKFWLIVASFLVSALFCSYPLVSMVSSWNKSKGAKEMFDMTNGVSQLLKTPLNLLLYSLVSVSENTTLVVDDKDSIDYYLEQFMAANAFTQTFSSSKSGYLSTVKEMYKTLDKTSFCSQLMELYRNIRDYYNSPQYTFIYQEAITESMCNSYKNGILGRGLTQATYLVYQIVNKLQTERRANKVPDTTDAVEALYMMQMFIAPTIEGLLIELDESISSDLGKLLNFMVFFYVAFILAAIITHFLFWTCFFKAMREEIIKSRGMLKLMPMELIKKLKVMKNVGNDSSILHSLRFFKQIQKKTQVRFIITLIYCFIVNSKQSLHQNSIKYRQRNKSV
eukprot:TRINITY_DN1320_c0_g1_i1.p1 TRINITY_DN1320_c0_g1~~TRINITY_DN1320_c0_g1_i1.p1  ORF type:complete len:2394 (+),score=231.59 TRINITY_DN1320_c0_g1_i1:104-7183(+)